MKKGAFMWFKYYVMLVLCNLKQQLNFEYFRGNLYISILDCEEISQNYESEDNGAGILSIENSFLWTFG